MLRNISYCPNCGEPLDGGRQRDGTMECDHCDEYVEPVDESDDAEMGLKTFHPIYCTNCEEDVRLVGLHMGQYSDGVVTACGCTSLGAIPSELGEPELPPDWEIDHSSEVFPDHGNSESPDERLSKY